MCSRSELNLVLKRLSIEVEDLFGDKLKGLILFGSYARGDNENESDIDIMILVDIDKNEIMKYRMGIVDIVSELGLDYEVVLSPIIQNYYEFEQYKEDLPFFKNIENEGVRIIA